MGGKARRTPLNLELVDLLRQTIGPRQDIVEKKMFGGIAFLYEGKMTCGVNGDDFMARVAAEDFEGALKEPHVRPMDFTGRPLKGFLYIDEEGWRQARVRKRWVDAGIANAIALPPKKAKKPRPPSFPKGKKKQA